MTDQQTAFITQLSQNVTDKKAILDQAQSDMTLFVNSAAEINNEIAGINKNDNSPGTLANNAAVYANKTQNDLKITKQKTIVAQANADYNDALQKLSDAQNALQSPADKAAAQAIILQAQADASNKTFMQTTTKYIIIGAIVLVVIAGIVWFMHRKAKAV